MQILLKNMIHYYTLFIAFTFCCFTPLLIYAETINTYDYDDAGNMVAKVVIDGNLDEDGDGLSNADEHVNGTDINNSDTDGDGMPDGWEVLYGLDPLLIDANGDADSDGISNYDEYLAGTDPGIDPDAILTDLVLSYQTIYSGEVKDYSATNSITAGPAYIVESSADVSCHAGNVIILKPGFKASDGSIFHAAIE